MVGRGLLRDIWRADALLVETARRLHDVRLPDSSEFHGLFVTEDEFLALLSRPFGASLPSPTPAVRQDEPGDERWQHLQAVFGLTRAEADILLLCLLPDIDLKYERIYGFLQDDVTCKRPMVDLLLQLLWPDLGERLEARTLFEANAPLAASGLVLLSPPADGADALLRRTVQVSPEVVRYLLEDPAAALEPCTPFWSASGQAPYPPGVADEVRRIVADCSAPLWVHARAQRPWCVYALASDMAAARSQPLIELVLDADTTGDVEPLVRSAVRDALLYDAVLLVRLPDPENGDADPSARSWVRLLEHPALRVIWDLPANASGPLPVSKSVPVYTVDLPAPDYEARLLLWTRALDGRKLTSANDVSTLAARYRLDGDQIFAAARGAAERARQRSPMESEITFEDLAISARSASAARLGDLASQIVARRAWPDLVLPQDRIDQIHEMCDQFRYRHVVYGAWGFGHQSPRGQGLSALFAGPSGTGKTMAAEVIANDLALDLYKIDLSGVVSKYIGETEKNLDRIFDLARDSNAILLFDEADALFGKRSETKDAHDRYANIEISYLLQKVEEYDGVVILTSNLRQNLDDAFLRRLQFCIEFPFPDERSRHLIWERTIPEQLPLAEDVDLRFLAERFRLSGGSIRNALVNAAFLAARDGEAVAMRHLLWGIRREFQKLGKLIDEDEFVQRPGAGVAGVHEATQGRWPR